MLTPDKIREKTFHTTGRGSYRADDVDSFLDEVIATYEQMFRENGDLIKKISILAKKVEEYRADEESLKLALLNAQKLADKITGEAKENAEKDITAAKEEVEKTLSTVQGEADEIMAKAKAEAERLAEESKREAEELTARAKEESEAMLADAKSHAEMIVLEANRQSNEILGNLNRKVTHETLVYDMLQKEASDFKGRLVAMYKEHIGLINQLPELAEEQLEEQEEQETAASEAAEAGASSELSAAETEPVSEELPAAVAEAEESAQPVAVPDEAVVAESEETPVAVPEQGAEDGADITVSVDGEPSLPIEDEPAVKAKPFKLDFSKIDFDDDDDYVEAPKPDDSFTHIEASIPQEAEALKDSEDEDERPVSFKNFFKKK